MRLSRRTAVLVLICAAVAAGSGAARLPVGAERALEGVSAAELHTLVETLASDAFRGRGVGDSGNRAAEEFICATLLRDGLTPAGDEGTCYQAVDIYRPSLGTAARLTVTDDLGHTLLDAAAGRDFYPLPRTGETVVTARLTAGNPQNAIALIDGDRSLDNADDTGEVDAVDGLIEAALSRRARGVVVVTRSLTDIRTVWPERPSIRAASYRLRSMLTTRPAPVAAIADTAAEPLRRALREGRTLIATLTPDLVATPLRIHNVLGLVEGRDGRRRDEVVVVGAHLDHDGIDEDGRIYNGADDNASGTAAVLAAAAAFAQAAAGGERPARTVIFALWNGEEKGELGAEAFVAAPRAGRRVVANLNLDMVGRHEEVPDPEDGRFRGFPRIDPAASANTLHVLGYSYAPDLAADLREANAAVGLALKEDYDVGAQNLLRRSDQWPFLRHGIPAVFLTTGLHPDYHTPDDDTARIDFGKLERIARLAARAAWIAADGKAPRMAGTDKRR